ncbi:hypothetical protein [Almyronema epifaneia]|uniref:Uncharacterized protein n=1 Tax=Almyronema epifaneia S1 TaxID=2991925 RepID=A0ABW6IAK4_9CYAN
MSRNFQSQKSKAVVSAVANTQLQSRPFAAAAPTQEAEAAATTKTGLDFDAENISLFPENAATSGLVSSAQRSPLSRLEPASGLSGQLDPSAIAAPASSLPTYLQTALDRTAQANATQSQLGLRLFRQAHPDALLDRYHTHLTESPQSVKVQQQSPLNVVRCMGRSSSSEPEQTSSKAPQKTAEEINFDTLASGNLKTEDLPEKFVIPESMKAGMLEAWKKSFPGGKSQEQGGILVKNKDGTYSWKAGAAGKSGSFSPNYGDVGADETLVASGHSHPYDKSEGGHTHVSFSGADLANLVTQDEHFKIVQAGEGQFVVSRTQEFNKKRSELDEQGKKNLKAEMKKLWNETFASAKGTFQERVEAAVKAVCSKYNLVYYKGSGGELNKQ